MSTALMLRLYCLMRRSTAFEVSFLGESAFVGWLERCMVTGLVGMCEWGEA